MTRKYEEQYRGATPLENAQYEAFCVAYAQFGGADSRTRINRISGASTTTRAYIEAFGEEAAKNANAKAYRLIRRPEIRLRIRHLMERITEARIINTANTRDSIEYDLTSILRRCMEAERVRKPPGLEGRAFTPCGACADAPALCESCQSNSELIEAWEDFGGVYKFDARGSLRAIELLGKEKGMFVDKRQVEHMTNLNELDRDAIAGLLITELEGFGYRVVRSDGTIAGTRNAENQSTGEVQAAPEAGGVSPSRVH